MAYTDLTSEFSTRHDLDWNDFEALAQNDHYNRLPNTTATLFFQAAAPAKWTKSTTHNDKAFRVVSGAGGGNGGSHALSSAITLAHTHTVNSHTHTTAAHQHFLHMVATNAAAPGDNNEQVSDDTDGAFWARALDGAGSNNYRTLLPRTKSDGSGVATGAAAPGTDSQLSNQTFAYYDAIVCTKD